MPTQTSFAATPAVCARCAAPLGAERPRATGLAGGTVCEPCQHEELEELLDQLEHLSPGPALPANAIPLSERVGLAGRAAGGP